MTTLKVAFLFVALALPTTAFAGETLDRVRTRGEVVNVLVNDYPPFGFINDKNELDGFDVDVARETGR